MIRHYPRASEVLIAFFIGWLCLLPSGTLHCQAIRADTLNFFEPATEFSPQRFWAVTGTGIVVYTGAMIGLNELWYKQYPRGRFHFFNDWKEWNQMDKAGHLYTAWFESRLSYQGARWAGIREKDAVWIGAGVGMLLQSSIEILDGFSTNWGFSVPDMAFNSLGVASFVVQQKVWEEQKIIFKVSSTFRNYSNDPIPSLNGDDFTSLKQRAGALYGTSFAETFLKDYNAQTVWMSLNLKSIFSKNLRVVKSRRI